MSINCDYKNSWWIKTAAALPVIGEITYTVITIDPSLKKIKDPKESWKEKGYDPALAYYCQTIKNHLPSSIIRNVLEVALLTSLLALGIIVHPAWIALAGIGLAVSAVSLVSYIFTVPAKMDEILKIQSALDRASQHV